MSLDPALLANDAPDRDAFRAAVKLSLPTVAGIAAWGMVVGVAMFKSQLTLWQCLGMTLLCFAGSAQLATLPLIGVGAPAWVIFLTAVAVNLRFVIFSALMAPHFAHLPWRQRLMLGYASGDMSVALFLQKFPDATPAPGKLSFFKGLILPNWTAWQVGSIAGIFLGSAIPSEWGLEFAATLAILCVMIPLTLNRPALLGVLVAGAVSILAAAWPFKLGLLAGVVAGMACAMAAEESGLFRKGRHE